MKQFFNFLVVAVFSFAAQKATAQTSWFKQNLDSKIAVKFPSKPEVQDAGPAKIYRLLTEADSTAFTANVSDFESMGLDSATLSSMSGTEEFANQFKGGFAGQIPGLKISKLDIVKWKDFTSYDIEGAVEEKKLKIFVKCVFIGSKMYTLFCATSPKSDIKNKDTFIDSIELL